MGLLGFLTGQSKIEKKLEQHEEQIKKSFRRVKKDLNKTTLRIEELEKVVSNSELEKMVEGIVSKITTPKEDAAREIETIIPRTKMIPKQTYSELSLSPAQKKIVAVLAQHNDISMSYKDISAVLNLTPTTVKNTVNQIKKNIPDMLKENNENNGGKRYRLNNSLQFKTMVENKPNPDKPDI
jgi:DNA-binding CsgD family transcriptional regulator